jgi:hypothetical protein
MSFVAGLVEVFASYRNENGNSAWNAKKSDGEKLSLLCGRERFGTGYSLWRFLLLGPKRFTNHSMDNHIAVTYRKLLWGMFL